MQSLMNLQRERFKAMVSNYWRDPLQNARKTLLIVAMKVTTDNCEKVSGQTWLVWQCTLTNAKAIFVTGTTPIVWVTLINKG